MLPLLLADREQGVLSDAEPAVLSRTRVLGAFERAVAGARDAPSDPEALARALYVAHLGVILWFLLDRSDGQWTTQRLIDGWGTLGPYLGPAIHIPGVSGVLREFGSLIEAGLLGQTRKRDGA